MLTLFFFITIKSPLAQDTGQGGFFMLFAYRMK
jgi:hypothetical protein